VAAADTKTADFPTTPTTGHAPTSFGLNLTGAQARTLADVAQGLQDEGVAYGPTNDFSGVVGWILDTIRNGT
jgi:hypothetical protein